MNFPLEKYKFFNNDSMVVAVSTYAGKDVKGIAKVDPRDTFDYEKGKKLAAARCNTKIAKKRWTRATEKINFAQKQLEEARNYYSRMIEYFEDAEREYDKAKRKLKELEKSM